MFIFNNNFSFRTSINNQLTIDFTPFEQMDFSVDSTRSRFSKILLNIFVYFFLYINALVEVTLARILMIISMISWE